MISVLAASKDLKDMRPTTLRKFSSDTIYKAQTRKEKLQPRDESERHHPQPRRAVRIASKVKVMTDEPLVSSDQMIAGMENGTPDAPVPEAPRIEVDPPDTNGEPYVQDFADRYIPKDFQPERSRQNRSSSPTFAHISHLQMSSDDEGAPPPPDLSRRGIHIPSRTR